MSETDRGLSAEQIAKQIDASLRAPADRLRRPLPVPPLRHRDADRGDDGGADRGGRVGQGALHRLQRVDARSRSAPGSRSEGAAKFVSSQPQYNMIWRAPEAEVLRALRRERDLADRLVAARPGGADRQVRARRGAAGRLARGQRRDELRDRALHGRRRCSRRSSACARSPRAPGLTMVQLALAWVLRRDEVASAIIGASRPEQVHANAAASGVELAGRHARGDRRGARRRRGRRARELAPASPTQGVKHR